MTDLPTLKKPVPPVPQDDEEWRLRMVSEDDPNDQHPATLEDVSAVLAAAGYVVVEKQVLGREHAELRAIMAEVVDSGGVEAGSPLFNEIEAKLGREPSRPRLEDGRQPAQCDVPEFGRQKVLEVCLGGTPRRATFADLHEVEREHWISLLPCSGCNGPVNDKICVTCFEILETKTAKLEQAVCEGIAKWDWGVIQKGLHDYRGGTVGGMRVPPKGEGLPPKSGIEFKSKDEMVQWFRDVANAAHLMEGATVGAAKLHEQVFAAEEKLAEAKRIAKVAIDGLVLLGQTTPAKTLREELSKL